MNETINDGKESKRWFSTLTQHIWNYLQLFIVVSSKGLCEYSQSVVSRPISIFVHKKLKIIKTTKFSINETQKKIFIASHLSSVGKNFSIMLRYIWVERKKIYHNIVLVTQ